MVFVRSSLLLALCAALAACSDGVVAPRELAAPAAGPAFALEAPAGDGIFALATGEDRADIVRADIANQRAAAGGRGLGQADMMFLDSRQTYNFTSLATGQLPSAKGAIHAAITNATTTMEFDATVNCMLTVGNQAWVSGPVTRFVFNGRELPAHFDLLVRVQDNGEGSRDAPDMVSPPFGGGPQACMLARDLPMLPNTAGNIQVVGR